MEGKDDGKSQVAARNKKWHRQQGFQESKVIKWKAVADDKRDDKKDTRSDSEEVMTSHKPQEVVGIDWSYQGIPSIMECQRTKWRK